MMEEGVIPSMSSSLNQGFVVQTDLSGLNAWTIPVGRGPPQNCIEGGRGGRGGGDYFYWLPDSNGQGRDIRPSTSCPTMVIGSACRNSPTGILQAENASKLLHTSLGNRVVEEMCTWVAVTSNAGGVVPVISTADQCDRPDCQCALGPKRHQMPT